jgi:hypothetical protein
MQDELNSEHPELPIRIIGVNEYGHESANSLMAEGRDLPLLQDVDANGNGTSDVWDEQWEVTWRDVVIVDANVVRRGAYNLTFNDLGNSANYNLVKSTAVLLAQRNPIWQNDVRSLDVNNDGTISPVGDVLACINELNNHRYSDAAGNLPLPAPMTTYPYLDVNGDYLISPVGDVLRLINHLNNTPSPEGEGALARESGGESFVPASLVIGKETSALPTAESLPTALPELVSQQPNVESYGAALLDAGSVDVIVRGQEDLQSLVSVDYDQDLTEILAAHLVQMQSGG